MSMFEGSCTSKVSVEVEYGDPCSSKDIRAVDVLETIEEPENGHVGLRVSPSKKMVGSIAQLTRIYTNARSMINKQEEVEAIVQWEL